VTYSSRGLRASRPVRAGGKTQRSSPKPRFTHTISGVLSMGGSEVEVIWFDRAASTVKLKVEEEWTGEPSELVVNDLQPHECDVVERCVQPAKVAS
jgi:hypothetical protein